MSRELRQIVKAMERVEERSVNAEMPFAQPLSKLMVESWDTKRFRFDYAMRKPLDVDGIIYQHLNHGAGPESLDDVEIAGLEPFVEMKMKQLEEYETDCAEQLKPN
jgi:hypothetical protein